MSFIATLINSLLNLIGTAAGAFLSILPDSPFQWNLDGSSVLLTWLFWLIPIPGMLAVLGAYVTAVAAYYLIRVALRWIKVVGS